MGTGPDFEVTLAPRAWRRVDPGNPECGEVFSRRKRLFWHRNLNWGKDLVRAEKTRDPVPLSSEVERRTAALPTMSVPHREGDPDKEYDVAILATMEEKTPQFNLRNVPRFVIEGDLEEIQWSRSELPDRNAYEKDLAEVRAARHDPPVLTMADYSGDVSRDMRDRNHEVFYELDWEQWLGAEHKKDAGGKLWTHRPEDGGKRTRAWPEIRITEHKFWKGRLITEKY